MYRILWVKCTTPAGCKSIGIAMSMVMDGSNGRFLPVLALSKKMFYNRKECQTGNWVPQRYTRGDDVLWAIKGWPGRKSMGYPNLEVLQNKTCFTNVFNKDLEMLYPQEKLFSKLFLSQQRYRGV